MIGDDKIAWLSNFSASYLKRWLSQHTEDFVGSKIFRPVMTMDRRMRLGVEAGLYGLMAYVEPKLPERTYLQSVFKKMAVYAAPELGQALVSDYRKTLRSDAIPVDASQAAARDILIEMDDEQLMQVLRWFSKTTPEERGEFRNALVAIREDPGTPAKSVGPDRLADAREWIGGVVDALSEKMGQRIETIDAVTSKLEHARERIRSRRRNGVDGGKV